MPPARYQFLISSMPLQKPHAAVCGCQPSRPGASLLMRALRRVQQLACPHHCAFCHHRRHFVRTWEVRGVVPDVQDDGHTFGCHQPRVQWLGMQPEEIVAAVADEPAKRSNCRRRSHNKRRRLDAQLWHGQRNLLCGLLQSRRGLQSDVEWSRLIKFMLGAALASAHML